MEFDEMEEDDLYDFYQEYDLIDIETTECVNFQTTDFF